MPVTCWGWTAGEVFRAWLDGTRYRSVVQVPAPLGESGPEKAERLEKEALRARTLAAAFEAGCLGHSRWTNSTVPSQPEQLALEHSFSELQAREEAPDQ